MRKQAGAIVGAVLLALVVGGCGFDAGREFDLLRVPLGRSAVAAEGRFAVSIDGAPVEPAVVADGFGGYWAQIRYDPDTDSQVTVRFVSSEKECLGDSSSLGRTWLEASRCIDAADDRLIAEARRIASHHEGVLDTARALQRFVADSLEYRVYSTHSVDPASVTYELGYGTCVNHARLFVALTRAAGIPARTVRGIVNIDGVFDHHHEWAEVRDEEGLWHQLDPVFPEVFDIASAMYLDLLYAPEENPFNPDDADPSLLAPSEWIAYDTSSVPDDGRLGFRLVESDPPDRFVVENTFLLADAAAPSHGTGP